MPYLGKDVQAFFAKQNNILPLKAPISLIFRFVRHGCSFIAPILEVFLGKKLKEKGLAFIDYGRS